MKAIILMTRIPIAGKTKTRLMGTLSADECAEIHTCFLKDIFEELKDIGEDISVFVSYAPEGNYSEIEQLIPENAMSFEQKGYNLGERMMNSLKAVFKMGYGEALLLGTDIPELKKSDIYDLLAILKGKDICLGPTLDGGYYAIGMKLLPEFLFKDSIAWGNKSVLETTVRKALERGLTLGFGPSHRDIDTAKDYAYLEEKLRKIHDSGKAVPQNTLKFQQGRRAEVLYAQR